MKSIARRIVALCIVLIMVVGSLPTQAVGSVMSQQSMGSSIATVDEMTAENQDFWKGLEEKEINLKASKESPYAYMKSAYKLVSEKDNVSEQHWIDNDSFSFTLSTGITCIYDYELRMIELGSEKVQGTVTVTDYSTKASHTTQCKNAVVFGPYYDGLDASFTDYYKNLGNQIASSTGGTCTILSSTQATPAAARAYLQNANNAAVFFDTHGLSGASSYVSLYGSAGITANDLTSQHAVALSGGTHYGVDGYFMTNMGQIDVSDCFIWIAACESMMTYGLGYPLTFSGAAAVLGYSQSVSFTQDYNWAGTFWTNMLSGKTVAQAAAAMKTAHGISDPYGTYNAYPVFMSATDAYPANPDAAQNVTCTWKLKNNDPLYTVTFKDYNGTTLSTQSVYQGEDAVPPEDPTRIGYEFSGWSYAYTNIQGNVTLTAQYTINTYTVTFNDWNGVLLKTQSVEHGSAATAPADPTRANCVFTGWDKQFTNIVADTVITAQYRKEICVVVFKSWTGEVLDTQNVAYGSSATAPTAPTRTGYTFTGWDKAFSAVTDDITVTAQYSIIRYTVTFYNYDESTVLKTQTVDYGGYAIAPTAPTRTGYTFARWSRSFSNVTENISVIAIYNINTYSIVFCDWDGTTLKNEQVEHGSSTTAPADPTRAGYRFTGWSGGSYTNVTANATIIAQYEQYSAPQYAVESTCGKSNNNVSVSIVISNNPGLKTANITFAYDSDVLELVSVANGTVMTDFTHNGNELSWTSTSASSSNGIMCTFEFHIKSGVATGTTADVSITATTNTDSGDAPVVIDTVSGNVAINNFMLGDANGDGVVNTGDALMILRFLADWEVSMDEESADVNGSGAVTTADAMYIMKYLSGDNTDGFFPDVD